MAADKGIFAVLDTFLTDCIVAIGGVMDNARIEPLVNCFKATIIVYVI
jgi:hypothetical protein